jgi:hypothetical protein
MSSRLFLYIYVTDWFGMFKRVVQCLSVLSDNQSGSQFETALRYTLVSLALNLGGLILSEPLHWRLACP